MLLRKYPEKDETEAVPLAFRIIRWKILEHRRRNSDQLERKTVSIEDVNPEIGGGGGISQKFLSSERQFSVPWRNSGISAESCCCGSWKAIPETKSLRRRAWGQGTRYTSRSIDARRGSGRHTRLA